MGGELGGEPLDEVVGAAGLEIAAARAGETGRLETLAAELEAHLTAAGDYLRSKILS